MTSKGKKNKKRNDKSKIKPECSNSNNFNTSDKLVKKNIHFYFNNEEISDIRNILKIREISNIPLVTGAIILNKLDLLRRLIKDGYKSDEVGPNNTTPLMWAIKFKHLDMIKFLLMNGADPNIKSDNSENVLIIAMEHKLWDEQSFLLLQEMLKKINKLNVNIISKNGHSLLHIAVRREWKVVINELLDAKINLNATNVNGVTSLMMACFRNNLEMVLCLLNAGADICKEDNHGRMAMCYAISSDLKNTKCANVLSKTLMEEMQKQLTFSDYLKRRIDLYLRKKKYDVTITISENMVNIIHYTAQYVKEGIKQLLDLNLLEIVSQNFENTGNVDAIKLYLNIILEFLFYNEQVDNFSIETQNTICKKIISCNIPKMCFRLLENIKDIGCASRAFYILLILSTSNELGQNWMRGNLKKFQRIYHTLPSECLNNFQKDFPSEKRLKLMKKKMKKFKRQIHNKEEEVEVNVEEVKKEVKRRKMIWKKPKLPEKVPEVTERPKEETNPITNSLKQFLAKSPYCPPLDNHLIPSYPDWKQSIINLPFAHTPNVNRVLSTNREKLKEACEVLKQVSLGRKSPPRNVAFLVAVVISYLTEILDIIIDKYNSLWRFENCVVAATDWENDAASKKQKENCEKEALDKLKHSFNKLVTSIKELTYVDAALCYRNLVQLEFALLTFEIRGKSLLDDVASLEHVQIKQASFPHCDENGTFLLQYIEDVLNDKVQPRSDILLEIDQKNNWINYEVANDLFCQELSLLPPIKKKKDSKEQLEAKQKTLDYAYHLFNSMASICDSDNEEVYETHEAAPKNDNSKLVLKVLTKHVTDTSDNIPSRWSEKIQKLVEEGCEKIIGDVKISMHPENRQQYIISQGGNFNPVVLGLTSCNQPLVVKRIPKDQMLCKLMKSLISPLLGLKNTNILHYYACDYNKENELIFATPLCEFNIGQYVLLMKEEPNTNYFKLTALDIVTQLLKGMQFLHKHREPIVHGNLKPTNVFVDLNGIVRVAEFGIHKGLYKLVEAPNSSLIWFSQETYQEYRKSSMLECTLSSDIHVAGMVIFFIFSGGVHPYGSNIVEILKNLEKSIMNLPHTEDLSFIDLITWMMMYDPKERPTIDQVLSHVIFWPLRKKWLFVLNCAGINEHGIDLLPDVTVLYSAIEQSAEHENIKDAIVSLLKCIRNYYKNPGESDLMEMEFSQNVLNNFPALPLSLYRILESTKWLEHPIFKKFTACSAFYE